MGTRISYPEADQSGRVAVVTGGNTGIGYETAKGLALLGAHVVIACRSEERATAALERMRAEVTEEHPEKSINVEFMSLDFSSLQSVKKFTEDYKQKGLPLHMLINNAAMMPAFDAGRQTTEDGVEVLFQVNHLGPFFLTLELLPLILTSAPDARIVFVSSCGHTNAYPFNADQTQAENLQLMSGTEVIKHYLGTKLYNIMAAEALQRRIAGKGVTVSSLGPGLVRTELGRNISGPIKWFFQVVTSIGFSRDSKTGSVSTVNAAVHPELNKGEFVFYEDCKPEETSSDSRNLEYQRQLWEISCNLLKDFLSPDVMREYGPSQPTNSGEEQPPSEQDQQPSSEQDQLPSSEKDQ